MSSGIAASDVAVLREQLTSQSRAIQDLTRNTERLLELTTSIALMQERMERHADGLDRAFSEIKEMKTACKSSEKMLKEKIDEVSEDIKTVEKKGDDALAVLKVKVNHWVSMGQGAWGVGSVLWVLIAWLLLRQVEGVESAISTANSATTAIERRIIELEHRQLQPTTLNKNIVEKGDK